MMNPALLPFQNSYKIKYHIPKINYHIFKNVFNQILITENHSELDDFHKILLNEEEFSSLKNKISTIKRWRYFEFGIKSSLIYFLFNYLSVRFIRTPLIHSAYNFRLFRYLNFPTCALLSYIYTTKNMNTSEIDINNILSKSTPFYTFALLDCLYKRDLLTSSNISQIDDEVLSDFKTQYFSMEYKNEAIRNLILYSGIKLHYLKLVMAKEIIVKLNPEFNFQKGYDDLVYEKDILNTLVNLKNKQSAKHVKNFVDPPSSITLSNFQDFISVDQIAHFYQNLFSIKELFELSKKSSENKIDNMNLENLEAELLNLVDNKILEMSNIIQNNIIHKKN